MRHITITIWTMLLSFVGFAAIASDLLVVRHGTSDHHITKVHSSNPDHPNYKPSHITAEGREEAQKVAKKLLAHGYCNDNIEAVYVSPLPRSQETAEAMADMGLFDRKKIIVDVRLIGNRAGDRENMRPQDEYVDPALNGESQAEVAARMMAFYDGLAAQDPQKNVILVAHSSPAADLIESITLHRIKLHPGECMVLPIKRRNSKQATELSTN
ncbi:MAG: histidine phosphatase family protein [Pseudomonadota bacterium]